MAVQEGLDGVVAFASALSATEGSTLSYRGYSIEDLAAHATFEEVLYLLWYGRLPQQRALDSFTQELHSQYALPAEMLALMQRLPRAGHPMDYVRTITSLLAHYDPDQGDNSRAANRRKATRLVARLPGAVATFGRLRQGQEPPTPHPELSLAAHFLYMLHGAMPEAEHAQAFDTTLIVQADHELSASTFAARVTVATLSDMYSGVVSAIGTLKGPLHGGANEQVMRMLQAMGSDENVEPYLMAALARKQRIMGFGHRVYKDGDPRARVLQPLARSLGEASGQPHWYTMAVRMQELMAQEKGLVPNVDFYAAPVYYALGLPIDMFTPAFVLSRVAGWTAHIMEQLGRNRMIRPRAQYIGPSQLPWQPLTDR